MRETANCKKCGKKLTDPISVAVGLGPECRGGSGRGNAMPSKFKRSSGKSYDIGLSQSTIASALSNNQPVSIGRDVKTHQPIVYIPDNDGNYIREDGYKTTAADLVKYCERYGFIHTNSVSKTK